MERIESAAALSAFLLVVGASCMSGVPEPAPRTEDLKKEIGQFVQIDEGIYRGAQPTAEDLRLLKQSGFRTVVSFRHEEDVIERERKEAEALGLNFVNLPWRIQFHPRAGVMESFLNLMGQKEEGPFFIHCRRGAERTGVADAVYRHYYQKLSYEEAYRKATEGFGIRFYWRPFMKIRYRDFVTELDRAGGFSVKDRENPASGPSTKL